MTYASDQAMKDIAALLEAVHRAGEWQDEHDDMLQRYRDARGEEAKGGWSWWAKSLDDESYTSEGATRADAVADLLVNDPAVGSVQVCEARVYNDELATLIGENDGIVWFADTRKIELLPTGKALDVARTSARYRPVSKGAPS